MNARLMPCAVMLCFLAGCAANELSSSEISRLKGGTTTVVVYGFCIPMDHLIKTAMTRSTLDFVVDGKNVGSMQTCSHQSFNVKSGYWSTSFLPRGMSFPHNLHNQAYRPGATQYLFMSPAGYGTFDGNWVDKSTADSGIAEIRKIGQMF